MTATLYVNIRALELARKCSLRESAGENVCLGVCLSLQKTDRGSYSKMCYSYAYTGARLSESK